MFQQPYAGSSRSTGLERRAGKPKRCRSEDRVGLHRRCVRGLSAVDQRQSDASGFLERAGLPGRGKIAENVERPESSRDGTREAADDDLRPLVRSHPTFIMIAARTAWGIGSTRGPRPRARSSRKMARRDPDTGVEPPARMFTTVPIVAPAPGRPPTTPEIMLPMPWPTSSRLGLWRVPVSESATREVRRLSTDPRSARMRAGWNACSRKSALAARRGTAGPGSG